MSRYSTRDINLILKIAIPCLLFLVILIIILCCIIIARNNDAQHQKNAEKTRLKSTESACEHKKEHSTLLAVKNSNSLNSTTYRISTDSIVNRHKINSTVVNNNEVHPGISCSNYDLQLEKKNQLSLNTVKSASKLTYRPILVPDFKKHVESLKENNFKYFSTEYESLDLAANENLSTEISRCSQNQGKNRYPSVVCYDHSRVILRPYLISSNAANLHNSKSSNHFDYINASYLTNYIVAPKSSLNLTHKSNPNYIAAQAPLDNTVVDFWLMIWDENVPIIIMMTNLFENSKSKCVQYFPMEIDGSLEFGSRFHVKLVSELKLSAFCIRQLKLTCLESGNSRYLHHYQYTAWPASGGPVHTTSLIQLIHTILNQIIISNKTRKSVKPILVHCSSGVGRSGIVIGILRELERVNKTKSFDVRQTIMDMRRQRPFMLSSEDHYIYLHEILSEMSHTIAYSKIEIPKLTNLQNQNNNQQRLPLTMKKKEEIKVQYFNDFSTAVCCSQFLKHWEFINQKSSSY